MVANKPPAAPAVPTVWLCITHAEHTADQPAAARPVEPWIAQSAKCIHNDVQCRSLRANTRFTDKPIGSGRILERYYPSLGQEYHAIALPVALPTVPPGNLAVRTVSGPDRLHRAEGSGGSGWAVVAGGLTHPGLTLTLATSLPHLHRQGARAPIGLETAQPRGRCERRCWRPAENGGLLGARNCVMDGGVA